MASGFFALLDDIATLMDDVAAMTKISTKKTAGILGDDLAVNAEKASGFISSRELPVLWAITKGSFLNKLIILPLAFLLSAFCLGPSLLFWCSEGCTWLMKVQRKFMNL
jgi:predicted DNA repair protein MutK